MTKKLTTYAEAHFKEFSGWVIRGDNLTQEEWVARIAEEKTRSNLDKILSYEMVAIRQSQKRLIGNCKNIIEESEIGLEKLNILGVTIHNMLKENGLDKK